MESQTFVGRDEAASPKDFSGPSAAATGPARDLSCRTAGIASSTCRFQQTNWRRSSPRTSCGKCFRAAEMSAALFPLLHRPFVPEPAVLALPVRAGAEHAEDVAEHLPLAVP